MPVLPDESVVDFPTLGFLAADWIAAHCIVPDGFSMGEPFVPEGWQLWCLVNHYRIERGARFNRARPAQAPAFHYRRSLVVGPQKCGKGPWSAAVTCFEAVGPALFAGWSTGHEVYRCVEDGCGCGFTFEYAPGEAMGLVRPTSLIQLLATSEDQVDNVYRPLQGMIRRGWLSERMRVREGFVRLPEDGRIDPVTAAANSKLGNPINFAVFDESGLYTARNRLLRVAQTMRRGLAGMSGRSIETTNAWDPMDSSVAQQTFESRAGDVFRFYRRPPADLSYANKRERHKVHRYVYAGSPWVDLEAIEAEAAELLETDPTQAERFFGNRLVQGLGAFMSEALWDRDRAAVTSVDQRVCIGFDGSAVNDWTALRCETLDGYRFTPTYGPDSRPTFWDPEVWGGRIPRGEVQAAVAEVFERYEVARMYCDPHLWETQLDEWALAYGAERVVAWPTNMLGRMFDALTRYVEDVAERSTVHDGDPTTKVHALSARRVAKPGGRYVLGKPAETSKIDLLMADVLAHAAAADARAGGWADVDRRVVVFR
jgi:hypothetical protein